MPRTRTTRPPRKIDALPAPATRRPAPTATSQSTRPSPPPPRTHEGGRLFHHIGVFFSSSLLRGRRCGLLFPPFPLCCAATFRRLRMPTQRLFFCLSRCLRCLVLLSNRTVAFMLLRWQTTSKLLVGEAPLRTAPSQTCRDYSLSRRHTAKVYEPRLDAMGALRLLSRVDAACCGAVSGYGGRAEEVFSVPHPRHEAQRRIKGATITAAFC